MNEKINDEMIEHICILAKLELNDDEKHAAAGDMKKILDYVDRLNELDTENIDPLIQVIPMDNVFRDDEITNVNDKDNMLANAPEKKNGLYVVPRTI